VSRIFITGATGFIGKQLVAKLARQGDLLTVLSRSQHIIHKTVIFDLQRNDIPEDILDGIDTVFHLAGFTHDMRDASEIEDLYKKINTHATVKLAQLASNAGVKKFIFVSSVKAGGISSQGMCSKEEPQNNPDGIYGQTKREAEIEILRISMTSDMHVSIVRPSLVYGLGSKGNLQLMFSGIKKGWFPPMPETGNERSMIHVDDLVRAILLVADDVRANGEIFIATDGVPHSTRKIYDAMCCSLGKAIPKWSVPKSLFDMAALINPRLAYKLNKLLGSECYSSDKLEALGFRAQKSLKDLNEKDF